MAKFDQLITFDEHYLLVIISLELSIHILFSLSLPLDISRLKIIVYLKNSSYYTVINNSCKEMNMKTEEVNTLQKVT